MNQTPAAMLILAASVYAHSVASRPRYDSFTAMIGIAAVGFSLWGIASLIQSYQLQSESMAEKASRAGTAVTTAACTPPHGLSPSGIDESATSTIGDGASLDSGFLDSLDLSPEVRAQLAVVAHQQGKHRAQVLDDVLRKHLPRYTSARQRVA
jgi:hypothetical protein